MIILTGFIAIIPQEPINGKDIWFQPIVNVYPYLSPTIFTVNNEELIFKGLGVFEALLNAYPYYHFTVYNSETAQKEAEYDYYDINLEADKPLLLSVL
ncbi:hypothetical protein [Bacillus toyonensis]|uniref:hypothetical protein n=1 Tax=Bacillus toyonensis TaxID=155322 RepID=UPI002E22FA5D|nr:hypothetical protein [Bacillus toyonensis]